MLRIAESQYRIGAVLRVSMKPGTIILDRMLSRAIDRLFSIA